MKLGLGLLGVEGHFRAARARPRIALGAALVCAAWLAGCGGGDDDDGGDGGGGGEVSFAADIQPIFDLKCAHCHHEDSATQVDLTDAFGSEGIIDRPNTWVTEGSAFDVLVAPGDPDASFILQKVSNEELEPEVDGAPMPLATAPLDDGQLASVRDWISAGANDDASFEPVAEIFGSDITLGRASGKCTFCHPGPMTRMDIIDAFDATNGLVGATAQIGGTRVIPGNPDDSVLIQKLEADPDVGEPMPFNPDRLTADEIADLTAWIAAGAPNN